jgi:hypothetical protein
MNALTNTTLRLGALVGGALASARIWQSLSRA